MKSAGSYFEEWFGNKRGGGGVYISEYELDMEWGWIWEEQEKGR